MDSIQWNLTFPDTNGILHIAHSHDFHHLFLSSLNQSICYYQTIFTPSMETKLQQVYAGHHHEVTGIKSDQQNRVFSISQDHRLLVTDLDHLYTVSTMDCEFALATLSIEYPFIAVGGSNYTFFVFNVTDLSMVCFQ